MCIMAYHSNESKGSNLHEKMKVVYFDHFTEPYSSQNELKITLNIFFLKKKKFIIMVSAVFFQSDRTLDF